MRSSTSVATEEPAPRRKGAAARPKWSSTAAIDEAEADYADERSPRGPWPPGEAPPTGLPAGMVGEVASCYRACWCHYRSARRQDETR